MASQVELPRPVVHTELSSESVLSTARHSEVPSPTSRRTDSTPASELSSIEALAEFKTAKAKITKENARIKAATLSLVEQVSGHLKPWSYCG
jgi:hypothetical protein